MPIGDCFRNLVPVNAVHTHNLMSDTAAISKRTTAQERSAALSKREVLTSDASCAKAYFAPKINAIALIVMSALNTLTFPIVGLLDFTSKIVKLDKTAFATLGTALLDTLKSAASIIVIAVALVVSLVHFRVFWELRQNPIPPTALQEMTKLRREAVINAGASKTALDQMTQAKAEAEGKAKVDLSTVQDDLRGARNVLDTLQRALNAAPKEKADAVLAENLRVTNELRKIHNDHVEVLNAIVESLKKEALGLRDDAAKNKTSIDQLKAENARLKLIEDAEKRGQKHIESADRTFKAFNVIKAAANNLHVTEESLRIFKELLDKQIAACERPESTHTAAAAATEAEVKAKESLAVPGAPHAPTPPPGSPGPLIYPPRAVSPARSISPVPPRSRSPSPAPAPGPAATVPAAPAPAPAKAA